MTLTLQMLPACEGDCMLLAYGNGEFTRRILIDGGRASTYQSLKALLQRLPESERKLELLVVTHIDRDHIEGVLALLRDEDCPVSFSDIWFNGYGHLKAVDDEDFGAIQGEALTELLKDKPWNVAFGRRSVRVPRAGPLPEIRLPGDLRITLLSPTAESLVALRATWERECRAAGLLPNPVFPAPPLDGEEAFGMPEVESLADERSVEDSALPNGSSIALLVDFEGRRLLLGADAHPSVLLEAIDRMCPDGGALRLDAFKLPHHGSRANLTTTLIKRVDCERFLVSTSGAYFKHPDRAAIARILKHGGPRKVVLFNYRSEFTEVWDVPALMSKYAYSVVYGTDGSISIDLSS